MKKIVLNIYLILVSFTSLWAQNHKVYCDKDQKYLKEVGTITNGKKEGYWKFYSCNEMSGSSRNPVTDEGLYDNDQKTGLWKFYDDGSYSYLAKTIVFVDGLEEGGFIEYDRDGKIKFKGFSVKGMLKGEGRVFYPNGKIKAIENFDTGGITQFFENGKVQETGFYSFDKDYRVRYGGKVSNGEWKQYYENGKLKSSGSYSSSSRIGNWLMYHDNGQLSATGIYKDDGVPIPNSWTTYDKSGQKDGLNMPEPQERDYRLICGDVAFKDKVIETERKYYEYLYEKRLLQFACVDLKNDDEETILRKVKLFWNNYRTKCKCDAINFNIPNGNILKYSIAKNTFDFIETLVLDYELDINFADPADGKNLLDYVNDEIEKMKVQGASKSSIQVYEKYRDSLISIGAKPSK